MIYKTPISETLMSQGFFLVWVYVYSSISLGHHYDGMKTVGLLKLRGTFSAIAAHDFNTDSAKFDIIIQPF